MLRALFISLSESRSLRAIAERSVIGQRVSSRFVAGNQVDDAIRVAAVSTKGESPSASTTWARTSPTSRRLAPARSSTTNLLDQIAVHQLEANVSLKLTHMGLDVDEHLARDLVTGLVQKAASMTPPNFVRVDMEGSPYTQRTLDFVHELHRMPGTRDALGP